MTHTLTQPAELTEQSARARGGLLSAALSPPEGWERGGLIVPFYGCGEPILRDKCISSIDVPHRPGVAEFRIFPIEQGSTCSTLSRIDHEAHALGRLQATTEWALGRQLATDQAGTGSPSLADANHLGTAADVITAIACLEQAAADSGFGARWWLHTSPRGAAYLASQGLMTIDFFSPSGAPIIVSPGYLSEGDTDAEVRFWATGPVWAAVDAPTTTSAVERRQNSDTAWALRGGIVAFDPCINISVDATVGACPTLPS